MNRNINDWERVASIAAGAALIALASRREDGRGPALATAGGLLARGLTGYCPVSALVGRDSTRSDTREALGGSRGIHVRETVTIAQPTDEVFAFWRDLRNLPQFMTHLERVEILDDQRSRWTARGPVRMQVTWDAEIINELPGELIAWRSLDDSDVASAGSVHFEPAPLGGTRVLVHLQYQPPGGKLGAWFASLFGEEPGQQIRADLCRLKALLETGDVPTTEDQPSGRKSDVGYPSAEGHLNPFREGKEPPAASAFEPSF
jgi:uncharacterized membrane protein